MTTYDEAQALASQITDDALVFNALNPSSSPSLVAAAEWGGLKFAEYALTNGAGTLAQYLPSITPGGNVDAFIGGVFTNALGRSASASDLTFYEHVVSTAQDAFTGFAEVIMYVGLSPESRAHNHGLGLIVA